MSAVVIQFPKLPHPINGAHCQVSDCGTVIDYPLVMCAEHMAMVPRPILCRIRQAWHAGDVNKWGGACVAAVQAVEDVLDRIALGQS